jgi:hypothetical protein
MTDHTEAPKTEKGGASQHADWTESEEGIVDPLLGSVGARSPPFAPGANITPIFPVAGTHPTYWDTVSHRARCGPWSAHPSAGWRHRANRVAGICD